MKKSRPNKVSSKQKVINDNYYKMLERFDKTTPKICTGCGKKHPHVKLSHSHIISRKHCHDYGMPELIYDPKNITFHCLSIGNHKGCHDKWESKQRVELLDYEKNIDYIQSISERMYYKYLVE